MKRRSGGHNVSEHLRPLVDDDKFLTAISRGTDPTDGADPLAGLLLGLRDDVEKPMPDAPSFGEGDDRRGVNPWLAGVIGAAAASVAVVGTGAALYTATPGSPLWGPASAVFGDRAAAVELASTLDQLEVASDSGDTAAARGLLSQAKVLVDGIHPGGSSTKAPKSAPGTTVHGATETETGTATVTVSLAPSPSSAPPAEPSAATATVTVTHTVTAQPETGEPQPTQPGPSEPIQASTTAPTTTIMLGGPAH
ncbi:hypothetical protein CAPI_01770 [Corynebacterium capitovis DSM 44611]|uniref:hypothetical protein n=1 Tax=Corynebacterium capitovis TaxID=131081 RepID=UPI00036C54FA|nr:hypothetical protein [Corynebacterium capitovis]WKD56928.1 hypothetical protein CAPI_01770 [Corynebacterium capitovis DSM 44611]